MTPDDIAKVLTDDINTRNGLLLEAEHIDLAAVAQSHPSLPQALAKYGIDIEKLSLLGSGDRGTAYDGGKWVVKITSDLAEAKASLTIQGMDIPGVASVAFAGSFAREHNGEPLYLVIQQKANTKLSGREKQVAELVGHYLTSLKSWPFDVQQATKDVFVQAYQKTHENWTSPAANEEVTQLLTAVRSLYDAGVVFFDVSGGNIGKDAQGRFCVFDLGISKSRGGVLPVIESLETLTNDRQFPVIL